MYEAEVWLISHGITADQEDENIEIGRFKNAYSREKKEIDFDNFKVKFKKSARMQLLFYIYEIKKSEKEKKWCWMKLPKKSWTQL